MTLSRPYDTPRQQVFVVGVRQAAAAGAHSLVDQQQPHLRLRRIKGYSINNTFSQELLAKNVLVV